MLLLLIIIISPMMGSRMCGGIAFVCAEDLLCLSLAVAYSAVVVVVIIIVRRYTHASAAVAVTHPHHTTNAMHACTRTRGVCRLGPVNGGHAARVF